MTKTINKELQKMEKIPHPKGRKVAQLIKKTNKVAARQKLKHVQQMKNNIIGEKFLWFRDNLNKNVKAYTPDLLLELMEKYHNRFNDELEQIKLKHSVGNRKGRQHASREDTIKMTITQERNEFNSSGIELPDILNQKQFNLLKNWSGELRLLQNFKLARFSKSRLMSLKRNKDEGKKETDVEKINEDVGDSKNEEKVENEEEEESDSDGEGNVNAEEKSDEGEDQMDVES